MVSDFTRRQFGAFTVGGAAAIATSQMGALAMEPKPFDPQNQIQPLKYQSI